MFRNILKGPVCHHGAVLDEQPRGIRLGAMAGAIGSRLLPPFIAKVAGSARIGADSDPFSVLIADHRIFELLLTDMEESAGNEYLHRTQLFLRLKRRLAAHAMAEEDVVDVTNRCVEADKTDLRAERDRLLSVIETQAQQEGHPLQRHVLYRIARHPQLARESIVG